MKDSKWVIVMLLLSVVSITVQNYLLRTDISRSREAYKKDLDDVYFLMKSDKKRITKLVQSIKTRTRQALCCLASASFEDQTA